jgi:hypothetical protein
MIKKNQIEALESYFKTENEHWNEYAFDMLCEVLKKKQFENPELPLQMFSNSIETFSENSNLPLKAFQSFNVELDKRKLSDTQKLFIYEWVRKYLKDSEFEGIDSAPIEDLIKCEMEALMAQNQPQKPLVIDIRESLKAMMQKELEKLPETLKELEPIQRLNILCKLMPFVLPKVESIDPSEGEPIQW